MLWSKKCPSLFEANHQQVQQAARCEPGGAASGFHRRSSCCGFPFRSSVAWFLSVLKATPFPDPQLLASQRQLTPLVTGERKITIPTNATGSGK